MAKRRQPETDDGIQDDFIVDVYNQMARRMRDKGWMETDSIIKSGIDSGTALEIGPGPGYLGLEWLKKTDNTILKGVDVSPDMIELAGKNAAEYGFSERVEYVKNEGKENPFADSTFDAVFTNGSLHEWAEPELILNEVHRVLKPGGRYFISDLRRDMCVLIKWFMYAVTKPKEIRPGLITSINAAYTAEEIREILNKTRLKDCEISANLMGLTVKGIKSS